MPGDDNDGIVHLTRKSVFDENRPQVAQNHLNFMKGATDHTKFKTPEYIKQFHEIKRFGNADPDDEDCRIVKDAYDTFMERLKNYTSAALEDGETSPWYQRLLKEIDEYVNVSALPPITEDYFWKNGWGATEPIIVENMSKFYAPINVNGVFRVKHDCPDGQIEFFKREDFINMFRSKCLLISVKIGNTTREKNHHDC